MLRETLKASLAGSEGLGRGILTLMAREADFYTPGEAAKLLGLAEFTVLGLLTSGELEGHQDEQAHWWIPAAVVDEAMRRSSGADAPVDPSAEETIAMPPVGKTGNAHTPENTPEGTPESEETAQFDADADSAQRTSLTDDDGQSASESG